ncbi:putative uncharacterized protein C8orf89 homolog isoform X2 [Ahaetulla prasina]|uniref:putative uncharacterized protein C8orf89 homolog isoform X2 n=1 Tax=Ahaetulla prasina TaxID=499056 RepID=UPI0026494A98|nr:putative uncharacterized protein C8orf89 homolog isoform X2 [Ahaetulla prasina]
MHTEKSHGALRPSRMKLDRNEALQNQTGTKKTDLMKYDSNVKSGSTNYLSGTNDLQVDNGKLPKISRVPKWKHATLQPIPKERKLPFLTPDNKFLDHKGKLFESEPLMDSWKNAVLKTKRVKQEYVSAYGLRDSNENTAMQCLSQSTEEYSVIPNPLPVIQNTQSCANQFPNSSDSNEDSRLPPLYLFPSTLSQSFFEGHYKSRGDITMGHPTKKEVPCISAPLKNSKPHCQAAELDTVRLKKLNKCSRLASFPGRVKYRTGYQFADPANGAPSQFLQRLAELAALQCTTIHEEKTRKIRKTKKQEA